jgi:hypothetical protein
MNDLRVEPEVQTTGGAKPMAVSYRQFRDSLLVGLALKIESYGRNYYKLEDIADEAGLPRQAGWVDMAGRELQTTDT